VLTVTRDNYHDSASSHSLPLWLRLKSLLYLRSFGSKLTYGTGIRIGKGASIKITETGKLDLGSRVILDDYSFVQLTKPQPRVSIGDYVVLGRFSIIAAKNIVNIGRYTQIAPFCQIIDQMHGLQKGELIANQQSVLGTVDIGQDCWIGVGVTVLSNVSIGDGVIIGAGSVVSKDVPSNEIWAGVPAKFIRKR